MPPFSDFLSLRQAAQQLGMNPGTLRVQVARKRLTAEKFGRDLYVTQKEWERYKREVARKAR